MPHKSGRRIVGSALESIMQDVMQGMQDFTREACICGDTADMEIIAVERPGHGMAELADVIPLPENPVS